MSGGGFTSQSGIDLFKRNYGEGSDLLVAQQNLYAKTWSKVKVSPLKPTPQGIYMPVMMSGNEQGEAINENQGFNNPDSPNPVQPQILHRLVTWPFVITGTAIELSETNKQAFAQALDTYMKDNLARMSSDLNRQILGKGTGQMALAVGAGVATTSVVVDQIYHFRRGQVITSYATLAGASEIDHAVVTAVNYPNRTITISKVSSWSDGSIIVKNNTNVGAPTGGKELTGFQAICDTTVYSTTFQGVSTATNPEWVGNVIAASNNNSVPISQDLLQQAAYRGMGVGNAKPNYLISNYGQARNFMNSEIQKTRYEPTKIEGGNTVLKWADMEWLIDKDYDFNEVGMYDLSHIEKFQTRDIHLAQLTGNTTYQIVGNDQIGGYHAFRGNIGTWKRDAQIRITGLSEPTL